MRMGKRITTILLAIALLSSTILFSSCSRSNTGKKADGNEVVNLDFTYDDFDNNVPEIQSDDKVEITDYKLIAENEYLQLYYRDFNTEMNRPEAALAVRDRRNGYIWHSYVPENKYSSEKAAGLNEQVRNSMRSLLFLDYSILNHNDTTLHEDPIMSFEPEVSTMAIENGIRIKYDVPNYGFVIVLEAWIEGDSLHVNVPYQAIKEEIGAKEFVDEKIKFVDNFADKLKELMDEISSDSELKKSAIRKRVGEINNVTMELTQLLNSIDGPRGIKDIASQANKLMGELKNLLLGGVNKTGLNRLITTDDSISDDAKDKYTKKIKEIEGAHMTATLAIPSLEQKQFAAIAGIQIMPFFGASSDTDEGYVFFPDGSGSISRFKQDRPAVWNAGFEGSVYAEFLKDKTIDIDWEKVRDNAGEKRVYLPVYGIKDGDNAFIATVTDGDCNAFINYYPSGYIVDMNRAFAEFFVKNKTESASSTSSTIGRSAARYEKTFIPTDYAVKIMFLNDEKADYSGMAARYRDYLIDNDMLNESIAINDKVAVTIDLLMGIKEPRVLIDKFIPMTTFEDAAELLEYLNENGVENVLLNLHGWTKDGYNRYPSSSVPAGKLGGVRGLKKLMETAEKTGAKVFLQDNYVEIYTGLGSINTKGTAVNSDGRIFYNKFKNINLYSPRAINKTFKEGILPKIADYGVTGVTFDRLGTFIYHDYQKDYNFQREDTANFFSDMVAQSKEKLGGAAVIGANQYTLKHADWLLNIPSGSTNYLYADEEIPFLQMVLHGRIPYSSMSMYNQFFDRNYQTLKMIEYGSNPYFRLTKLSSEELNETSYDSLFSSEIDDWKDEVVNVYKEFNEKLSFTADNYMTKHEIINKDLVRLEYSDGSQIYLNYSDSDIVYEGNTIKAMDYLVIN